MTAVTFMISFARSDMRVTTMRNQSLAVMDGSPVALDTSMVRSPVATVAVRVFRTKLEYLMDMSASSERVFAYFVRAWTGFEAWWGHEYAQDLVFAL